ncbi:MAG: DegV family protein [Chloroflexi bacterium]|nr:DegV family protein [Chloroflexota bacterium]
MHVVTDSTCDLPRDLVAQHGITVVPLTVVFGDEQLLDGVDIDANQFYARLREFAGMPKTSQPSVARFRDVYESVAAESGEIVSIHISSRLSGTLNSASIARDELSRDIHVDIIDSYNVSMGLGQVVLEAALAAERGAPAAEVAQAARHAMDRTHVIAVVDTLEYLRRGGRIGRASSLVGSLLSIKPLVHVERGEVAPFERVRTRTKARERLFELATKDRTLKRVFVGGGGNDDEALAFMERLRPLLPHTEFHLGQLGPAVGVHVGPNVLGVALLRHD